MRRYVGRWWTKEAPDDELIGTLTIQRDGRPDLAIATDLGKKTEGSLAALLQPKSLTNPAPRSITVLGQERGGTCFTLYDGMIGPSGMGSGGVSAATLFFNRGIKGACVDDPENLPISRFYSRYTDLDAWLGAHPFNVENNPRTKISASYDPREPEYFPIDDNRELVLKWIPRGAPHQVPPQVRIKMEVLPWLGVRYKKPVTPEHAADDANNIAQLLSMLVASPAIATGLTLISPECKVFPDQPDQSELLLLGKHFTLPKPHKKLITHDVMFPFELVREQFANLLQRWFRLRHECWGVIVPYLVSQRSPAPMAETRFFDSASAAESLHAHLRPAETNFSDAEARRIWKQIRRVIPEERRRSFAERLQRVNALTYRQRLEQLLGRFPTLAGDVIGDRNDQETFSKLTKRLRDTFAHNLTRTDETNPGGSKLVRLTAKLKVFIDAWILASIGVPDAIIEERMRRTYRYWFYASRESWPWNISDSD